MPDLRQRLIDHIMLTSKSDKDYAQWQVKHYDELLPWLEIRAGVLDAVGGRG